MGQTEVPGFLAELDNVEMNIVSKSQGPVEKGVQRSLSRVW